ncbi:MAG: LysM domain-containing protein [Lachnospiraceae bacterium]|nr:LysM domain-containing protein [Lachnospiraceae bacterium]
MYKVYFGNIYIDDVYYGNVLLPVTPEKITMKIGNNNKTLDLINGGEVNFLRTPGLTEFSFDFLIPQVKYPFASYPDGFQDAAYYVGMLEHLKTNKKPFTFSVYRTMPNGKVMFETNMNVSLEEYTLTEDVKNGLDSTASVKLKEYAEHKTIANTITIVSQDKTVITTQAVRPSDKVTPKTYTVKSGDTLWAICKANLGDGSKYKDIATLNGIANPNLIYPGQVIKFDK